MLWLRLLLSGLAFKSPGGLKVGLWGSPSVLCSSCPARCGGGALRGLAAGCPGRGVSGRTGDCELGRLRPAPTESRSCCCQPVLVVRVPAQQRSPLRKRQQLPSFRAFRRSRGPDGEANGLGGGQGAVGAVGRPGAWSRAPAPHATAAASSTSRSGT